MDSVLFQASLGAVLVLFGFLSGFMACTGLKHDQ